MAQIPSAPQRSYSAWELIHIHAETLFLSTSSGQLRFNADPGYSEHELEPAPRFWLGQTAQGVIWRVREHLPTDLIQSLEPLVQNLTPAINPVTAAAQTHAIRTTLQRYAPITGESSGPAYWMPDSYPVPSHVILITPATAHLLSTFFPWKQTPRALHLAGPLAATIVDGCAVAICFCARLTTVAAEAGVETTELARGYGYGKAAVAGWAAAIRSRGLLPMYSTSWENRASQAIARRLGMLLYAHTWSVT